MSLYFVVDRESGPTAAGSTMIWRYSYTSTGQFYITVVLHLAFAHHVRATAHFSLTEHLAQDATVHVYSKIGREEIVERIEG